MMNNKFLWLIFLLPLLYSCQKYSKAPYDEKEEKLRKYPDTLSHILIDSLWQKRDSLSYLRFKNVKQITLIESDSIPSWIINFQKTEVLYISNYKKRIKTIPKNIGKLSNLIQLDIPNNEIKILPSSFYSLKKLERLNLNNNSLTTIPEDIEKLSNLTVLLLENNKLEYLPTNICRIKKLKRLTINDNFIQNLPKCITFNLLIESISINNTRIKNIPLEVLQLPSLRNISAMGLKLDNYKEVKEICKKRNIAFYYDE